MNKVNLIELLDYIPANELDYSEWVQVGMALKEEGYSVDVWDNWSSKDFMRYHPGECQKKWDGFSHITGVVVTGATITQMAKDRGYQFKASKESRELDWEDEISDDLVVVDQNWVEGKEVIAPKDWDPAKELITYLETLFDSTENVGYVTTTWEKDGKYLPTQGAYDRTAGQLIQELSNCKGDIGAVFGDYKEEAGAWIRFNPLDGKGVKNENVTDYRFALVESDTVEIEKQNAIIRELELPVACLVYSGKKSVHAIVKINASTYDEYRKRVDYLYNVCKKNGLAIDTQNRNPSRLSRMPGIVRNGKKQFLIDTNIGKASWDEWKEWIEGINDDLPNPESLEDVFEHLPDLANPLIDGVLRQGHKMLIAGPSKAGKSYALIGLCISIAEGKKWLKWNCTQGKVLYVNLELDRASCLHRFKDVYNALGYQPKNISNIDIWNLRGKAVPMDALAPKLIRRASKKGYIAVIIDPIYKIITGDENSADQMAHFTNQFDKVCTELGSAVIYCHHHSKGYQGSKRSMDRASGSGVFARDPDALIDMTQLEISDNLLLQRYNRIAATVIDKAIQRLNPAYSFENIGPDDRLSANAMREHLRYAGISFQMQQNIEKEITQATAKIKQTTAWRLEGTLREFASFEPVNMWFEYPIHRIDDTGVLKDVLPEGEQPTWQKQAKKGQEKAKEKKQNTLEIAYSALEIAGEKEITVEMLMEEMGVSKSTFWRRFKESDEFISNGKGPGTTISRKS